MHSIRTASLTLCAALAATASAGTVDDLVAGAKLSLDLRYRIEAVDQVGFAEQALASTLRARLGGSSGSAGGFSLHGDFEVIGAVGVDDYNSTANGLTQFPVIADPTGSELNQAFLQWKGAAGQLRYGRQRFVLDNHRFIGNVGFRQNEQTFDATTAALKLGRATLTGAWIWNADRIFGEDHPNPLSANTPLQAPVLHLGLPLGKGKLSLYAHAFEFEAQPANSHSNVGLRWANDPAGAGADRGLRYAFEFAQQDAYADGAATIDQDYALAELGWGGQVFGVRAGVETLGGDGVRGFQTPFATLHAFNGWADRFLSTPADGLVDAYLTLDLRRGGWSVVLTGHDFSADFVDAKYGRELDLGIFYAASARTTFKFEYADYAAETFATDTRIVWLTAEFKL